jgi:hypothetical protein
MVGTFEYGFVIKALYELMKQKETKNFIIFFTFILFPSQISLSLFFFFLFSYFSFLLIFFRYFFCSLVLLQHNAYSAFVRDDVMTPSPCLNDE